MQPIRWSAGVAQRAIVREFANVPDSDTLTVELVSASATHHTASEAVLSGMEIEEPTQPTQTGVDSREEDM